MRRLKQTKLYKYIRLFVLSTRRKLFPVDVEKLRDSYKGNDGIVALINFLSSPEGKYLTEFGSSSIVLDNWPDEPLTRFIGNNGLYIGSRDGSLTPLEWLEKFSIAFPKVSPETQKRFDKVLGEFVKMPTIFAEGNYEEVSEKELAKQV